jgi:hypothetical protein
LGWYSGSGDDLSDLNTAAPSQTACRFMDEIRRNPEYYVDRIRQSIVPKRGKNCV